MTSAAGLTEVIPLVLMRKRVGGFDAGEPRVNVDLGFPDTRVLLFVPGPRQLVYWLRRPHVKCESLKPWQ